MWTHKPFVDKIISMDMKYCQPLKSLIRQHLTNCRHLLADVQRRVRKWQGFTVVEPQKDQKGTTDAKHIQESKTYFKQFTIL